MSVFTKGEGVPISVALTWFEAAVEWLQAAQGSVQALDAPSDGSPALDLAVVLWIAAAIRYLPAVDHPTRRWIYEHLLLFPGNHFRSIARSLDLGLSTARYHLGVLIDRGAVRMERDNGRCRYYATGRWSDPEKNDLYTRYWSLQDLRTRVLSTALGQRDRGPTAVSESLGISRQLARYHLTRLRELGRLPPPGAVGPSKVKPMKTSLEVRALASERPNLGRTSTARSEPPR